MIGALTILLGGLVALALLLIASGLLYVIIGYRDACDGITWEELDETLSVGAAQRWARWCAHVGWRLGARR